MSSKNELVIDGEIVIIDPDALFQRLLLLVLQADRNEEEKEAAFCYELCHKAPSLFDQNGLMRDANSATLIKSLVARTANVVQPRYLEELPNVCYVIDGDWFIDKITWQNGKSFDDICGRCLNPRGYMVSNLTFHSK